MSDGGEITIPPGQSAIKIAADGTVSTAQGVAGKLRVVSFLPGQLTKEGKNLYSAEAQPEPAPNIRVLQGMIERSNVEPVVEMTKMIEIMRAYQHATETLSATSEIISRAVQRLGEVRV
jgi:flagellar basal-body rod protein FlgF